MSGTKAGARVRAEAAKAIDAVVNGGRSLDAALADAGTGLPAGDLPMLRMLCYGSLRHHFRLRDQLDQLLDRPLKKRDRVIESLIAVGLFQLGDTRVPDHAAVSMTVEAARLLRLPKFAGLVNAVLRNFGRKGIAGREPRTEEARWNHPAWLLARLEAGWPDDWQRIAGANNDRAPMWLRVNRRHMSAAEYLATQGVEGTLLPGVPDAIRLAEPVGVESLPGFDRGLVSVQDAAAQIAAPWLLKDGGHRLLDACAAPGGKTGHLLEILGPDAHLTALDSDVGRLGRVRENLDRLSLDATLTAGDASKPDEWHDGERYDRILLDAPCSATGVIRRHPDIKVLRRDEDIHRLSALQSGLLEALWGLLAPGGRLLYVTCSVLADENEAVVGRFLEASGDAAEDRVLHNYNIRDLMCDREAGFQILPGTEGLDGFYFACLTKAVTRQDDGRQDR